MRFVILCALGLCNIYGMGFSHANSHHPQEFLKKIAGKKREGHDIVAHYCATCHAKKPLISLGAPRMGVPKDWSPRLKQGLNKLLQHTEEGIGLMPARGGCFECSDHQLKLAVMVLLSDTK